MSLGQTQLVKWSLPALALILGLLWYKRRRVDRVDPGGPSSSKPPKPDEQITSKTDVFSTSSPLISSSTSNRSSPSKEVHKNNNVKQHCDSGINSDESLNVSSCSPAKDQEQQQQSSSPRKVSESRDIPGRSSSLQSSGTVGLLNGTPWYEDEEDEEVEEEKTPVEILGSQPAKSGRDLLSKSRSSAELLANGKAMKEGKRQEQKQQPAKVVVANGTPLVQEFQTSETKPQLAVKPQTIAQQPPTMENGEQMTNGEVADKQKQSQVLSERDSANHSPVSGVLDGSVTDEARSEGEGSTDSGKGGSINGGRGKDANRTFYEFSIPTKLVGKLIGRGGRFLENVRNKAGVQVSVKRNLNDRDTHVCNIDGTPEGITTALEIIRKNFPEKTYPYLTLEQIVYDDLVVPDEIAWMPELIQLTLVEGVNNDVVVCHILTPDHFFIQLPTHPTYPSLRILSERMTQEYETVESPPVPDQLTKGMIVVAKLYDKWVRVLIENPDPQGQQTLARLVDLGGYWNFSNAEMRKIRADYISLPFQAIEVFLANVQPKDGEWTQEAYDIVAQLSANSVGQAQIVGYGEFNTYINLYYNIHRHGFISIADELRARGLAEPLPILEEVVPQEALPSV